MLSSFKLDLKEVSLLPSTQVTHLRRSSKEEGQEQRRGHGWAGLETWDSLTSKRNGAKCAGACLPGSSGWARGPKEKCSAKMKYPLYWQREAGGPRPFSLSALRDGLRRVEAGWVAGSCCRAEPALLTALQECSCEAVWSRAWALAWQWQVFLWHNAGCTSGD